MNTEALAMNDEKSVSAWCTRYGITVDQLTLATSLVGLMPAALHFYLTSRGRPTKIVTDEMRASRAPIRPRDRRRKLVVDETRGDTTDERPTEVELLRLERAVLASNVRVATDALHARPCPTTIHAYDDAQRLLDEVDARLDAAEGRAASPGSAAAGFTLKDGVA